MDILMEYHHKGSDRNRARLYRNIDPETISIINGNLYFAHFPAAAHYMIKLNKKVRFFMNPDEIKEEMKRYTWGGDHGESLLYHVKDLILQYLGDNVDYYISPEDYDTAAEFKKALYYRMIESDYLDGDTEEETEIRRKFLEPALDEIFQESITEQDFAAMKAERE